MDDFSADGGNTARSSTVAPLCGRDGLLAELDAALDSVGDGRGRTVLLRGQPGVGKSRLMAEVARRAAARSMEVLRLRWHPDEADIPLAPLRRRLGRIPEGTAGRVHLQDVGTVEAPTDLRFVLVEAATQMVQSLVTSTTTPWVFLLEDLHWADPESLQLIQALSRQMDAQPALIVGNARLHPAPAGLRALMQMPDVLVRDVTPLGTAAMAELLQSLLGGTPGPRLVREAARTGGVPFYVEQLASTVVREGTVQVIEGVAELVVGAEVGTPSLGAHVSARLDALSSAQRQAVQVAALVDADLSLLADVMGEDLPAVARTVEPVVTEGLLVSTDQGRAVRVRHELVRDEVRASMSPVVRSALHTEIARVLTARGTDAFAIAPHLMRAAVSDSSSAIQQMAAAARELAASAPAAAAPLFQRAFDHGMHEVGGELVSTLIVLGDIPGAAAVLDRVPVPDPLTELQLAMARGQLQFLSGDLRGAQECFEAVADQALILGGHGEGLAPDLVLAHAAVAAVLFGRLDDAERLALKACSADPVGESQAANAIGLIVRGWVRAMRGDPSGGRDLVVDGHARARGSRMIITQAVQPDFFLGQAELWDERPAEAVRVALRGLARTRELGTGWHGPALHATAALGMVRLARWDEAKTQAEVGIEQASRAGTAHGLPWCHVALSVVLLGRGQPVDDLLDHAQSAVRRLAGQGAVLVLWQRAAQAMAAGEPDRAMKTFGLLWARLDRAGLSQRMLLIVPDMARAAELAEPGRLPELVAWVRSSAVGPARPRVAAAESFTTGLLQGDPEMVARAGRMLMRVEDMLGGARMLADAVRLAGGPSVGSVREHARRAATVFGQAGATALLPSVLVADPLPRRLRPTHGWDALTKAQMRVVRLVANGMSNQEIADHLSLSRRTVESHLHQAYGKLGLGSRVELAVAAAARFAG